MYISLKYTIPSRINLPGQSGVTPPPSPPTNFIELEADLFLIALESDLSDVIGLEA
jgi:hypothetical protein